MAVVRRKTKKTVEKYEEKANIKKLFLYITIVNSGVSQTIINIFNGLGCSAQFIHYGNGTANKQILDILGIEENKKEVVISIVSEDMLENVKKEISAFFLAHPKNKGIGFSISMTSIIGVRAYQFLSNSF